MRRNIKLIRSIERLLNPGPVMAGAVRSLMSSCGKAGCKCTREINPEKHPYHQLSYTHDGKTKTLYVKNNDLPSIKRMTDNYKNLRCASLELGHEAVALIKAHGVKAAEKTMTDSFDYLKRKSMGMKSESAVLRDTRVSRDNWKVKALRRQAILEKNKIKIRDMKKSRDNWKNKMFEGQKKIKKLQKELALTNKNFAKAVNGMNRKKNFAE